MKVRLSGIPTGGCFLKGRGEPLKKLEDGRYVVVSEKTGKSKYKKVKGDPEVETSECPLRYLGVGLRRHPESVVEIGDGNILKRKKR